MLDHTTVAGLTEQARGQGMALLGEDRLLRQLTKLVLKSLLEGEMDARLGCAKHDRAGRNGANSDIGRRSTSVLTEADPVEIAVPRDRDGSFTLQMSASGSSACTASTASCCSYRGSPADLTTAGHRLGR